MTWQPRIRLIQEAVSEAFHVTPAQICGPQRSRWFVVPRQTAMYIAREMTSHSTTVIARHFNRDHTTVLHGLRATRKRMDADPALRERIARLMEDLRDRLNVDAETDLLIETIADKAAQALKARLRELAKLDGADILRHLGREI